MISFGKKTVSLVMLIGKKRNVIKIICFKN